MTEITYDNKMTVDLIDFMGGDMRAVQAARVSTKGTNDPAPGEGHGLVNFLMRERHEVPFEHSVFTFLIEAPIFVTRQLLKHRLTSISETSGRYRELDAKFYVPSAERPVVQSGKTGDYNFVNDESKSELAQQEITFASEDAWWRYERMINTGISKEIARLVLPVNLYSSMYLTINARSLMNLLSLRNEHHAQYEIREVAQKMDTFFKEKMPVAHQAWLDK